MGHCVTYGTFVHTSMEKVYVQSEWKIMFYKNVIYSHFMQFRNIILVKEFISAKNGS